MESRSRFGHRHQLPGSKRTLLGGFATFGDLVWSADVWCVAYKVHVNVGALPKKKRHCFESGSRTTAANPRLRFEGFHGERHPQFFRWRNKEMPQHSLPFLRRKPNLNDFASPAASAACFNHGNRWQKMLGGKLFPTREARTKQTPSVRHAAPSSILYSVPKPAAHLGISSPNCPRWLAVQNG